ncbi:MAG: CDP-glycerol glycerophosphotransferase family protein [Clostridia bacterium]|nr:CDP-glycerol glycerophosphotransferase family protein [Clostridia bacterium]
MGVIYSKENIELLTDPKPARSSLPKRVAKVLYGAVIAVSKRVAFLRRLLRKMVQKRWTKRYNKLRDTVRTEEKTVLFSAFDGRSYTDSPKAIYLQMLRDPAYRDYKLVWAFRQPENYVELLENPNTYLVRIGTAGFEEVCAAAKYWLFNYRVADHIYPREDQVYAELWHGTPLKRLGYDIEISDNAMNSKAEIRDKYRVDAEKFKYLLAPSPFAAEKFESAWNLKAFGKSDTLLIAGYPRNDFLINHTPREAQALRERMGLPADKKIILYAPTWRDNQHQAGVGYTYELGVDFEALRAELEQEYVILFRAHYLVASQFDFAKFEGFVYNASNVDDINDLYVIADLLITDYSSVFFDFANLNRPMLFYMYDREDYGSEIRGFYIDLAELPGPIVEKQEELVAAIRSARVDPDRYRAFREKFNPLDDGQAAARVIKAIIQ